MERCYNGCLIETWENWEDEGMYDVCITYPNGDSDVDFARSDNEEELIEEAMDIIDRNVEL